MPEKTAIIIGAGPAGLTAAYRLLRETDIRPVILEETPWIGGISRTVEHGGNRMDLGGHRFFTKSDEVMALWKEIMPIQGAPALDDLLLGRKKPLAEGGPDPEKCDRVMLVRDRVSRILYMRRFFDYPVSLKLRTVKNLGFARTAKAAAGYVRAAVKKRPERSLEDFYINRFGRPLYEMFFEDYTEKVWGVHPRDISPDWGAQRVKGLSLSKAVFSALARPLSGKDPKKTETSLIEQFYYPKKGPGQLWEQLAAMIMQMGGVIRLNTKVVSLRCEGGRIARVAAACGGGVEHLTADYYISSMPVKDLICGMEGPVPPEVRRIAENLPYRDFITVGLLLKSLRLKNETGIKTLGNIVPDCWIYVQEPDLKLGRLQIFNNWSPYMVRDPESTVFVGLEYFCGEGDGMWRASDGDLIAFAAGELEKIGVIRRDDVIDAVRVNVKKAYPAYFGSYSEFHKVRSFLDTIENLYCIGRNGQHKYNNMDHSMLTAIEAVRAIKEGKNSREDIWNVNAESEYHEVKKER